MYTGVGSYNMHSYFGVLSSSVMGGCYGWLLWVVATMGVMLIS